MYVCVFSPFFEESTEFNNINNISLDFGYIRRFRKVKGIQERRRRRWSGKEVFLRPSMFHFFSIESLGNNFIPLVIATYKRPAWGFIPSWTFALVFSKNWAVHFLSKFKAICVFVHSIQLAFYYANNTNDDCKNENKREKRRYQKEYAYLCSYSNFHYVYSYELTTYFLLFLLFISQDKLTSLKFWLCEEGAACYDS